MHPFPELLHSQRERVIARLADHGSELLPLSDEEAIVLSFSDFVLKQVLAHSRFCSRSVSNDLALANGNIMSSGLERIWNRW